VANAEITGENIAEIRVNLRDKHQRDSSSMQIVRELRPPLQAVAAAFPHSVIQLLEDAPGPPVRSTILAEIYGSNPTMLREISTQVRQVFQQTWDVAEVNSSEPVDVQQQLLVVDSAKAALSGLTTTEVAMTLHRFFSR
jgi:multidrug efflux pump subunit AcrB